MSASIQGLDKFKFDASGSNIKSIQRGTITFANSVTTQDITISAIDLTKAIVIIDYREGSTDQLGNETLVTAYLKNSTTITLDKYSSSADTADDVFVAWQVIEFNNVKSLQTGSIALSANTIATVTTSLIDTSKAILFFSYIAQEVFTTTYQVGMRVQGYINSSTSLFFYNRNKSHLVRWQLVEFN